MIGELQARVDTLISVEGLRTYFTSHGKLLRAVDGATYQVRRGTTLCLIGESGSGKTVSVLSILGVIDSSPGIVAGSIRFEDRNLLEGLERFCTFQPEKGEIRKDMRGWRNHHHRNLQGVRGSKIAMIFQDPVSALNPLITVGDQLGEVLRANTPGLSGTEVAEQAARWLERVRISDPIACMAAYPFQLSGGMCQRVSTAIALCSNPALLIADEPTTALDATVQLEMLKLLRSLQEEFRLSMIFITHDMYVSSYLADDIAVMYGGKVVECGPRDAVLIDGQNHPYTEGLLASMPALRKGNGSPGYILGNSPDPTALPPGCRFHPRCPVMAGLADGGKRCVSEEPIAVEVAPGYTVSCWKYAAGNA